MFFKLLRPSHPMAGTLVKLLLQYRGTFHVDEINYDKKMS